MKDSKDNTQKFINVQRKGGNPETAEEQVNTYGTYNIQPTADTDHVFPTIAQGLPKQQQRSDR